MGIMQAQISIRGSDYVNPDLQNRSARRAWGYIGNSTQFTGLRVMVPLRTVGMIASTPYRFLWPQIDFRLCSEMRHEENCGIGFRVAI